MKRYLILLVLLLCSSVVLFGQEPKDDPNVMWTYKWTNFSTYPAVHPNGNVIIGDGSNGDVIEINGLTGDLVRRIKVPNPPDYREEIEISQDGTRIIVEDCLIDYASGEVIMSGLQRLQLTFLNPYNDKLIQNKEGVIRITDLNDNKYTDYDILSWSYTMTAMKVSNDGKYLAIAQRDYEDEYDWHTHFYLYDAQTMKLIRELEDVVSEGRTIETIQFSENSKYVGYGQLHIVGTPKATFFTCELPYKKWEIKSPIPNKYGTYHGAYSLGLIKDNYVYLSFMDVVPDDFSVLYDIQNDKIIYETKLYHSTNTLYNSKHNSIITGAWYGKCLSLDLDKILNSVGVDKSNKPLEKFNIFYSNGLLKIEGYTQMSNTINLSISDTLGNIVFSKPIIATNSIIEIPLVLPSGTYILQIQDGQNHHSQKFIVVN